MLLLEKMNRALKNTTLEPTQRLDLFDAKEMIKRIAASSTKKKKVLLITYLKSLENLKHYLPHCKNRIIHRNFTESNILTKDNKKAIVDLYDMNWDYAILEILMYIQNVYIYKKDINIIKHILEAYNYKQKYNEHEIAAIPDTLLIILISNCLANLIKYKSPINTESEESYYKLVTSFPKKELLQLL